MPFLFIITCMFYDFFFKCYLLVVRMQSYAMLLLLFTYLLFVKSYLLFMNWESASVAAAPLYDANDVTVYIFYKYLPAIPSFVCGFSSVMCDVLVYLLFTFL